MMITAHSAVRRKVIRKVSPMARSISLSSFSSHSGGMFVVIGAFVRCGSLLVTTILEATGIGILVVTWGTLVS